MKGAVLATVLGHTVLKNTKDYVEEVLYVTDSTIVLYWITQDNRPLQASIRNSVIQINRLSVTSQWFHVETDNNVADIGTRPVTVDDIKSNSSWQNGMDWMVKPREDFPLKTAADITLTNKEKVTALKEIKTPELASVAFMSVETPTAKSRIKEVYEFSNYLVDPNKRSWRFAVRAMCTVFRAVDVLKSALRKQKVPAPKFPKIFSEEEIERAEQYYFRVGTKEVKKFSKLSDYKGVTTEKDGVLYYNSRVLDDPRDIALENVMSDVDPLKFVRPVLHRYSPLAYSVMSQAHTETNHRGSVTTLTKSRETAFIINGMNLASEIRNACPFCRRFKQRLLALEMSKVHRNRLTIAPVFYHAQADLCGPFHAFGVTNKRATVKIYALVIKCCVSTAVSIQTMEDYSSLKFSEAYTRHSAQYNHPKVLYIDAGTQLVHGCNNLQFSMVDWINDLNTKKQLSVDARICPVGAHNFSGQVERSIKSIKILFDTVFGGLKLTQLGYQTSFAWIAAELNNIPICLGSSYENFDRMDLLTPNRLIHGSNIDRTPSGPATLAAPSRTHQQQVKVQQAWMEAWQTQILQKFIPRSKKWRTTTEEPKIHDIVVFPRKQGEVVLGEPSWRVGRIKSVQRSSDNHVRRVTIEYRNSDEKTFRTTERGPRQIAILHAEGDIELTDQLNDAARLANLAFSKETI